jgi:hypothetical protein
MSITTVALDLDTTGVRSDNLITDEPHDLSSRPTRSIAPRHGAFFASSVRLYDGVRLLTRGIDYQIVELHQEATLRFGKEIASVLLVINPEVSSHVTITYQALGGHYSHSDRAIANLYESVINDRRPVDWKNIFNRPSEFNPTIHRHLLDDVYGFEPVVDYLERIKRAITLGQTDVLMTVIRALLAQFQCKELPKVLPSQKLMAYDAFLYFMSRRKLLSDTWIDTPQCRWLKGDSSIFEIDSSAYPVGTTLYWQLYKPEGSIALFPTVKGTVQGNGGVVQVSIYTPSADYVIEEPLYLGVRDDPLAEEFKAVTYQIKIQEHASTTDIVGYLYGCHSEPNEREMFVGDIASDPEQRLYYMLAYR